MEIVGAIGPDGYTPDSTIRGLRPENAPRLTAACADASMGYWRGLRVRSTPVPMHEASTKEDRVANAVARVKEHVGRGGHMATFKMGTLKPSEWAEVLERLRGEGYIILHDVVTVIAPGHEEKIVKARE